MAMLKPELDEIKEQYAGDKDKIADMQLELFKRNKYNPFSSIVPTLIQLPIILGLIHVVNNPDLYLAVDFDPYFAGFNLAYIPTLANPGSAWILAGLAILATFIMCVAQNNINPMQSMQSAANKWGMTAAITVFIAYFTFIVPLGLSLYWTASNILQIFVMLICNVLYSPRRYIDMQIKSQRPVYTKEEKLKAKENKARERADLKRFYKDIDNIRLIFISPSSGYYKYYKNFISYIIQNSDINVHYITSDPLDQIFKHNIPSFIPYYVGEKALIPLMMKLEADIVVMTMPDLGHYHIKRSWVKKDIEYIFADHSMNSMHMVFREGSLDYYDTIFCVHSRYMDEVRASEALYGTKKKNLVAVGYNLIDDLIEQYNNLAHVVNDKKVILIAPSWQKDNMLELCIDDVLENLLDCGYKLIVRPHPEFSKRYPNKLKEIMERYAEKISEDFIFETDFNSSSSIFTSDMLITDWSAIAIEFSYTTLKPSLFINTPPKVMNPNYKKIPIVPLDIALRDLLGVSVDVDKLSSINDIVADMFSRQEDFKKQILETRDKFLFNLGNSGEAGGKYIIDRLGCSKKRE